jgi:hypothetical protein
VKGDSGRNIIDAIMLMNMNITRRVLIIGACVLLIGVITAVVRHGKKESSVSNGNSGTQAPKSDAVLAARDGGVLVETDEGTEKINLVTGEKMSMDVFESEDFSGFSGLPKVGNDGKRDVEQAGALVSKDKSKTTITIATYDNSQTADDQGGVLIGSDDYLCDIAQKNCQKTDILSQTYQGLDEVLQKDDQSFMWSDWDSSKNLLFGRTLSTNGPDIAPVYACNTQIKICVRTEGAGLQNQENRRIMVPEGAFSTSLGNLVMVSQNDDPNSSVGKKWELFLYSGDDLSKPVRNYDISAIIDDDESVEYDSVYSVAWSSDEKKIAIGTARRIFMFDVESDSLSLVYLAPSDDDSDPYWDPSALFMSPDGKFIAFVDSSPDQPDDIEDGSSLNTLKKIDLEHENMVSEMYEEKGLSLKLQ